jgi:hypothetical protein
MILAQLLAWIPAALGLTARNRSGSHPGDQSGHGQDGEVVARAGLSNLLDDYKKRAFQTRQGLAA